MSESEIEIKRWTAKRKTQVVLEVAKALATHRQHHSPNSEN